jgi:molybdopterin molybdotransferase
MNLLSVDTVEQARENIWTCVKNRPLKNETVSLDEGLGRILALDIFAEGDIPAFNRATVDGYAVHSADTAGAGEAIPVFLKCAGEVSMGESANLSIGSGECAYVPTGGMLPAGADAVAMVEYCENAGGNIAVYEAAASGAGVALAGEDIKKGALLLRRGTQIRPQEAGALSAAGITSFPVFVPLGLSIISTGDELVPPEEIPNSGKIRDINSNALKALSLRRGYNVVSSRIVRDNEASLEAAIREAIALSDVVVISGGSSKGEKDSTASAINRAAKPGVFCHGLSLKPGKPTILGWDEGSQTLLAGLPGHPVAAMVVFELILGWLHDKLFDRPPPFAVPAKISCNVPGSPGRTVCQPVILHLEGDSYLAEPVFGKSGMITTLTRADGYIKIDLNKEGLKKGESVMVQLL